MTESTLNLEDHPMYTPSDLAYFRNKGYDDGEILAFWNRDMAAGKEPLVHKPAPNVMTVLQAAGIESLP